MCYELDENDFEAIESARVDTGDPWKSKYVKGLKKKVKAHYRAARGEVCCYCVCNTHGEHNYVLHIEHVLPQSHPHFSRYIFEPKNLSVACLRCNFEKGADISFLTSMDNAKARPFDSETYKFIHPNFDSYHDHLDYTVTIRNKKKLIKYSVVNQSEKGKYTYVYFKLHDLEVNSFNMAQGAEGDVELSTSIPDKIARKIEEITTFTSS